MPLTSSMEDYLEAVLIVAKKQIEVRSVDIARQLNVSKPSVWRAMTVQKMVVSLQWMITVFFYSQI